MGEVSVAGHSAAIANMIAAMPRYDDIVASTIAAMPRYDDIVASTIAAMPRYDDIVANMIAAMPRYDDIVANMIAAMARYDDIVGYSATMASALAFIPDFMAARHGNDASVSTDSRGWTFDDVVLVRLFLGLLAACFCASIALDATLDPEWLQFMEAHVYPALGLSAPLAIYLYSRQRRG